MDNTEQSNDLLSLTTEIVAAHVEEPPKVVNLMEALRKSLDAVKKKPAKAVVAKPAAKRKRA